MALIEAVVYSAVLGREVCVNIILPHGSKQFTSRNSLSRVPVLYLLHGLTHNHTAWCRKSSLERYVMEKPLAVVMPDGGRSFYTDTKSGVRWFEFITDELPSLMCGMFPISDKREDTYIAGMSMGGYGALKAALTYPDKYAFAASMSGVVDIHCVEQLSDDTAEVYATFGNTIGDECDLYKLAEKCRKAVLLPQIYQSCGTEDFLYGDNIKFRDFVKNIIPDYSFYDAEYGHDWDFWDIELNKIINKITNR